MSLPDILAAGRTLFGSAFNPLVAQKARCYFVGGDLETLDDATRATLIAAAARDLTLHDIPRRSHRLVGP